MRPILRPGAHVLRRDRSHLQVGLDPDHAVVLPDNPATRSSLTLLAQAADAQEYAEWRTLQRLQDHELLLDASALLPLVPPVDLPGPAQPPAGAAQRRTPSRHDVAALARHHGAAAGLRLSARHSSRIELVAFNNSDEEQLAGDLEQLLRGAGFETCRREPHDIRVDSRAGNRSSGPRARLAALVGVGEPRRELVDEWMRDGVAHLVVRLSEGRATVGPFVAPGRTACLRCLDAQRSDTDPAWPLLVAQYARVSGRDRADGVPEPVDSLLAQVALAWAARDLATFVEDGRPSTWSATVCLDTEMSRVAVEPWLRHPECGCGWR